MSDHTYDEMFAALLEARKRYPTQSDMAAAAKVSKSHMHRVFNLEAKLSGKIASWLGYEKVIVYRKKDHGHV